MVRPRSRVALAAAALAGCSIFVADSEKARLIVLDPGHFHAALIQKEALGDLSPAVRVYAPLGPDLTQYLDLIAGYNARPEAPTSWELEVYAGPDYLDRMLADRAGDAVVISGRNRGKIDRIQACVAAGFHVLADKPWIIEASEMPKLEAALDTAERNGVLALDIMTQRYDVPRILSTLLIHDPAVFGEGVRGSESEPAVSMESVHHILKTVSGAPIRRPVWFFDIEELGEGLADVGTHLVDLVSWTHFTSEPIDWRKDVAVLAGERWPTVLTREQFQKVTGQGDFPEGLRKAVEGDRLKYFCNNRVEYVIKGMHVRLSVTWKYEAPPGEGDCEVAIMRGTRSRIEVRQGVEEGFVPQVYVVPNRPEEKAELLLAVERWVGSHFKSRLGVADQGARIRIEIPGELRTGHEGHFAQLVGRFLAYIRRREGFTSKELAWERQNMLGKYFVTTRGVELARQRGGGGS